MINIIKKKIDVEELLISKNIIEIAKQTICHNTGMSIMIIPFLKNKMSDEEINHNDFLFDDKEDNKKEFANFFCESILNDYKDFDFTNVKKFDLIDFINNDLNNIDKGIQENQKEIQTLTENNEALQLRVDTLTKNNKVKDKLFGKKKEREKYMDVAEDLYSKKIIEEDTFEDLQDTYEFSKNHDCERDKDDFDLSM